MLRTVIPHVIRCLCPLVVLATAPLAQAAESPFADAKSPFLRSHADDKVRWLPWGEEAFARAKAENKPIFVYVGYTGAYWCEQMRRELFAVDGKSVSLLDKHYISVLIDKDEHPALNNIFMTYGEINRSASGWPLCVWLTPDLIPFSVGGFFGKESSGKRPAFGTVLDHIVTQWEKRSDYVDAQSKRDIKKMQEVIDRTHEFRAEIDPEKIARRAIESLSANFDPTRGGFSGNVGFPNPSVLDFLAESLEKIDPDSFRGKQVRRMLLTTIKGVVHGGLYDQIGEGFFRYTIDPGWMAPSFEKDLVSQARLCSSFTRIAQRVDDPIYQEYVIRVLEYILNSWKLPSGLFANGLDSMSDPLPGSDRPRQGAYYTWQMEELKALLTPEEQDAFFAVFSIEPKGNFPLALNPQLLELEGLNVPRLDPKVLESGKVDGKVLASAVQKVAEARARRPRPERFDVAFTGANALFISALAEAAIAFRRDDFLHAAAAAGDTLWEDRYDIASARLFHSSPNDAKLKPSVIANDYSCLVAAFLDLHDATGEMRWLQRATQLQDAQLALFWDVTGTGIHEIPENSTYAPLRTLSGADRVLPASNTLAVLNLVRLEKLNSNKVYRQRARDIVDLFSGRLDDYPLFSLPLLKGARQLDALAEDDAKP